MDHLFLITDEIKQIVHSVLYEWMVSLETQGDVPERNVINRSAHRSTHRSAHRSTTSYAYLGVNDRADDRVVCEFS